ncbi:hypothetical protein BJ546DRAFT_374808 [Cryomyces antarcticus]
MLSTSPRASSTSQLPSSGRRLISKITSPFAPKVRNVTDFYIQPSDPHRQYAPGDIVSGSVVLKVVKPVRVTHIVVCLHGFVQVYKNPNSPGDGVRGNNAYPGLGRGNRSGEYFGNGFASLFEDEVVLCGEGRLSEGLYHFKFDLEFPGRGLPSSIDFERGTISYMVTATMTRPTTISPTMTCDRKVFLVENIDIAALRPPKPRTISLEPISRRSRVRANPMRLARSADEQLNKTELSAAMIMRTNRLSEPGSVQSENEVPQSPSPSAVSVDSLVSSSGNGSVIDAMPQSARTSDSSRAHTSKSSLATKTITATIDLLQAGCLRGDSLPLKITVNHTKHIKSLHGVIVTLYRQARVDMHPALPLGPMNRSGNQKYEDYYPKSITGLAGLSLSGAGSSHVFRKDLSQSFTPLIVNPHTLSAEVNTKVRVPDEVFPTISSVPGAMITFKYYVEVVLDLQGKLSGLPSLNVPSQASAYGNGSTMTRGDDSGSTVTFWGGNIVDTEPIRRDRNVVACLFEVVVGTKDSDRKKGKLKAELPQDSGVPHPDQGTPAHGVVALQDGRQSGQEYGQGYYQDHASTEWYGHRHDESSYHHDYYYYGQYQHDQCYEQGQSSLPSAFPPPNMAEEDLPEKERLRRAEARLLPSQPPDPEEGPSSEAVLHRPSAPLLPDEHASSHYVRPSRPAPPQADQVSIGPAAGPSAPPFGALEDGDGMPEYLSSAPEYAGHDQGMSDGPATEDKQELQRRRLQMEASAPEDLYDDDDSAVGSSRHNVVPSAPTLVHEDELGYDNSPGGAHPEASGGFGLPRYER